jgi:hypothetical protein
MPSNVHLFNYDAKRPLDVVGPRRGMDLLLARPDIDPRRIPFVGHSYGAHWGAILGAIDKRFKTMVLMAGVAHIADGEHYEHAKARRRIL